MNFFPSQSHFNVFSFLDNFISSLDFNPQGEKHATIDFYGICLISDVDTNNYNFHLDTKSTPYGGNYEVPWSINISLSSWHAPSYPYVFLILIHWRHSNFSYSYHVSLDGSGRCRWGPNTDEPLLFIKYNETQLNILDVEKKILTLKDPIQMDKCNCSCFCWDSTSYHMFDSP